MPVRVPHVETRWMQRSQRSGAIDVVVTDALLRQALVFIRELGRDGHRVGAVECQSTRGVPSFASRWCHATARVPDRDVDPGGLVDALIALSAGRDRKPVLLPTHDGTIAAVA